MKLTILDNLERLIRPLSDREYKDLEMSMLKEGCRDPIIIWKNIIIDGHHRYKICQDHGIQFETKSLEFNSINEVKLWMINNQLSRRNLDIVEKAMIGLQLKKIYSLIAKEKEHHRKTTFKNLEKSSLKKINTNKAVAEIVGVSHTSINKVDHILNSGDGVLIQLMINKRISIDKADKLRRDGEKEKIRTKIAERGKTFKTQVVIKHGDFKEQLKTIPAGSVKAIITDPPYHYVSLHCYSELAEFAQEKLCDNGFLATYAGQLYLPDVMARLGQHLDYYWTIGMIHQGHTAIVKPVNVICEWKPILIYQKGKSRIKKTFRDKIDSGTREKEHHDWGQSLDEAIDLVEMFSDRDDLIVDPFLGGGTTAISALITGRRFIGAEIDEAHYKMIMSRLKELHMKKIKNILNLVNKK